MNKLKNLVRRSQLVVLILLVLQVCIKTSFAQNQLNYSPTINFTYTNEKAYTADINNDTFNDIVMYNTTTGLATALKHNGNNNANAMEFDSIFSITLNGDSLIDVMQIDQSGEADLITYKEGVVYDTLTYYPSTGTAFSSGISLTDSLPHADYQFGTLDINNDGVFDIYALNQANNTLYYCIVNTATLPLSFSTLSLPAIPSNSTVHSLNGHFGSDTLNDLCYIVEYQNQNDTTNSNYFYQVIKNNGNGTLSVNFSFLNNGPAPFYLGVSPNQQFYAGKFTNDDFTDIAIYPANQHVYVLHNLNGINFDSILLWQSGITQPPNKFTFNAGNYKGTSMYNTDELMLLETYTDPQFNSDLGRTYIDTVSYTASAYTFGLNEMSIAPCFGNPIVDTSTDFHLVNGDFNSDGSMDMVLYNPTKHILKVGIMQSVTIPSSYVQGYCWPQSAAPGQSINFYISGTPSSTGTIDIFRYVSRDDKVIDTFVTSITLPLGITTQISNPDVVISGCGWNVSAILPITNNTDWPSGYYAARVSNEYCASTYINFIVKRDTGSINTKKLALIANTNTWCAYNEYTNTSTSGTKYGIEYNDNTNQYYSFMRPSSNNGIKSNASPHLARAELWIYTWLKDNGYDPDVITDMDVHLNADSFLNNYDYLVMGTHPEYWTGQMYDHVKSFQTNGNSGNGGNLICLGGNAVFEVVDIDLTNAANPKLIAYPNNGTVQQNAQYPLPGMIGLGGEQNSSPTSFNNIPTFDRFDYFLESYNFGTAAAPVYKRSLDLIGTHYQNLASLGVTNTSYKKSIGLNTPLFNGITSTNIGVQGYNSKEGVQLNGEGAAAGWECDRYTAAVAPLGNNVYPPTYTSTYLDPLTPASPATPGSVYDNDILVLASSEPNQWSNPQVIINGIDTVYCPNGMNNSEIIYVPSKCSVPKRGFVFTAGSVAFGGSLVWDYQGGGYYDNDLSRLMKNVFDQPHLNFDVKLTNVNCNNNSGILEAISCNNNVQYNLQPGNVTNNTGLFNSGISAGTYTITASMTVGGNTYTISKTAIVGGPSINHCACVQGEDLVTDSNVILLTSPTALSVLADYAGANGQINNRTFYIDDIFTIDENITFNNCTLWFTSTGEVVFNGPYIFDVNSSTLQTACDTWLGIIASDPANKVSMSNSTLQNATSGILISNNATLEATNCHFKNNPQINITYLNMSNPSYAGKVWHCTFEGDNMTPYNGIAKPQIGVAIMNSDYIDIGDALDENNGNTFTNIYNGIYIYGGAGIATTLPSNSNTIGIYNNKFIDINNGYGQINYNQIMQDIYNSNKGSAIYIDYSSAPAFDAHTTVSYTGATTASNELFSNCTKAIISKNNNLTADKLYIKNCDFGIMNYSLMSKDVSVLNNKIENAHIGTQLSGNYKNYDVNKNDMSLTSGVEVSNAGYGIMALMYPAIGIDIKQLNPPYDPSETHLIDGNTISIPYYSGKGISNMGANQSQQIKNNTIKFTVAQGTAYPFLPYNDASLYGIFTSNCKDITIDNNLVDGQYSNSVYSSTYSKAYYFETSQGMIVSCNKARATKQGLYAWGKNNTSPEKIHHNKFKYNLNPLYTLDAGNMTLGTFGNIGNGADDNSNEWLYNTNDKTYLQNQWFKVWRNSNIQLSDKIFTIPSLLDMNLGESGSSGGVTNPYKYGVDNTGINPVGEVCASDPLFDNSNPPVNVITVDNPDIVYAETIALQNETYLNFLQVGEWLNNRWLFDRLEQDDDLRNSSPILNSFYNNFKITTIGNIEVADMAMASLFDFNGNESDMITLYNEVMTKNNEIVSVEDHELNERIMNATTLRMLRYGVDSITETQKLELEILANTCPFVGGSAVYKARILWAVFNPMAQYNDRLICLQSAGQNKNGNSSGYINLDSLYEAQVNEDASALANQLGINNNLSQNEIRVSHLDNFEDVMLYPNPANDFITISSKGRRGDFQLYDATGRLVFKQAMNNGNFTTKIVLPKLSNGLYSYKILLDNGAYTGKINIHQHE